MVRFNYGSARASYILAHFLAFLCKTVSSDQILDCIENVNTR